MSGVEPWRGRAAGGFLEERGESPRATFEWITNDHQQAGNAPLDAIDVTPSQIKRIY